MPRRRPPPLLARLGARHPDCVRYAWRRGGKTWLGATPETLVRVDGRTLHTDALAGTRQLRARRRTAGLGQGPPRARRRGRRHPPRHRAADRARCRRRSEPVIRRAARPGAPAHADRGHAARGRRLPAPGARAAPHAGGVRPAGRPRRGPAGGARARAARPVRRAVRAPVAPRRRPRRGGAARCRARRPRAPSLPAGAGIVDGSDGDAELAETRVKQRSVLRRLPGRRLSEPADDLHSAWAHLFAASLAQCGVAHAVISPGSRSTPLALALAAQLPTTVLHDERVAAFFALGQARASGRASVVLATSGTAPGHWLPAVMEAREAGLPLLLLSADRPWEVQQAQASQTVDQMRLFGHHANAYFELGLPDAHPAALRAVPRIAAQAVLATRYPLAGAVQVNAHFRKPLEPQPSDGAASPGARTWRPWHGPARRAWWRRRPCRTRRPWRDSWQQVRAAPRGVLVAGPMPAVRRPRPAPRGAALPGRQRLCAARRGDQPAALRPRRMPRRRPAAVPSTRCCVSRHCGSACARTSRWRSARRRCRRSGWRGSTATTRPRAWCCPASARPIPAGGALGMLLGPVAGAARRRRGATGGAAPWRR